MNKAQIEALISYFQDEIDIIFESLNIESKEQIFELYSLLVNPAINQEELTRIAQRYAGDNSQKIIDNVNRLRRHLILQPQANDRVTELGRLGPALSLTNYFTLLNASMLSYITSTHENLNTLNDLTKHIQAMRQNISQLEQGNQKYKTVITQLSGFVQTEREEKAKIQKERAEERSRMQSQLASQTQQAERLEQVEAERQRLNRDLLSIRLRHEVLTLPLKLQQEAKEKETIVQNLIDRITQLALHESELNKIQEELDENINRLRQKQQDDSVIATQLNENARRKSECEKNIESLNRRIRQCRNHEIEALREERTNSENELINIESEIERLKEIQENSNSSNIILKELEKAASANHTKLRNIKGEKLKSENELRQLNKELDELQKRIEGIPQPVARDINRKQATPQNKVPLAQNTQPSPINRQGQNTKSTGRELPKAPIKQSNPKTLSINRIDKNQLFRKLNLSEIKKALEQGQLDVNTLDDDGRNLLHHACRSQSYCRYDLVDLLIRFSIKTCVIDRYGKKAVDYAAQFNDQDLVNMITNHKATTHTNHMRQHNQNPPAPPSGVFSLTTPTTMSPMVISEQEIKFNHKRDQLLATAQKINQCINQRGDSVYRREDALRQNGQLASYDESGTATPSLASSKLSNESNSLALLRQYIEDCQESTSTTDSLYCAQYINLLLNQVTTQTSQFQCLSPMTVTTYYQTLETFSTSIITKLISNQNCLPLHINHNHWVVLLISKNGGLFNINYIDPFGKKMPAAFRDQLSSIFGRRISINELPVPLQGEFDGINCGVFTVEICRAMNQILESHSLTPYSNMLESYLQSLQQKLGDIIDIRIKHLEEANTALANMANRCGIRSAHNTPTNISASASSFSDLRSGQTFFTSQTNTNSNRPSTGASSPKPYTRPGQP